MKEAIWGVLIVVLGLFGILVVNLFQNVTVDNDRVYYLIKETTQAAAYDAIDLQYYRTTGNMKIAEDKFIENLTRRFAQNVTIGDYTIIVEDLNEVPPKISLRIRSGVTSLRGEEFGLLNRVDGVIEAKYKIDEVIDFLCEDKTAEECNTIRQEFGVKVEIDSSSGENRCASDISDEEMDCIPGDITFLGWGESNLPIGICQDEEAPRDRERTARYAICECGKWSSEKEKKGSARIVDVIPYYNYVEKETYYTEWSGYYSLEELKEYPIEGPEDERFPDIASDAKNVTIETDYKMYYRYRDKLWRYYEDNGGSYSDFSSEQPAGYAYKDEDTVRTKDCSPWSLNYPEEKDYRYIRETYGSRWYYLDGKTKVYWNSGAYSPEQPDETYNLQEREDVRMYCYEDDEWRWYNGEPRYYSNFMSEPYGIYTNRDEGFFDYTSWSYWDTVSELDDYNSYYREEESENRPRYRLKYDMYSFNKLEGSLSKEEFENIVGKTLQQIIDDPKYDLVVTYKYKTRKK
jgi:hypothetical protein